MASKNIEDMFYEAEKRLEWFINGRFVHCIPASIFKGLATERICELYNVELKWFRPNS